MKIKAIETIIEWDQGQMVVINAGETGELSDALAQFKIDGGQAAKAKGGQAAKAEDAPEPAPVDPDPAPATEQAP